MSDIPTLTTERLILRQMQTDDWKAYFGFLASDRARYMGGPYSQVRAWGLFCSDYAQWGLFGFGGLMIQRRDGGPAIGQVSINYGPSFPEYELGWFVYPDAEGQGIAYEAAIALCNWARQTRRLPTLVSYVDPQNDRSRRLAERLGAVSDVDALRPDATNLVYRHYGRAHLRLWS
ncbi:GNAT family N-acetyltransferase [Paracoccus sp. 11-3]|uniref:GNAT family N-acetyltransferase n=1 Tax=Paracoccus amoyensis TaxID=2760093 RepID=A0A926GJS8_9RHOB|nr:GNAT family N-acetyltransferase [Paracoccus amoyensis]MBC9248584.1 GNAT family N-acetyltransferase [Paracoccus amoyensis]